MTIWKNTKYAAMALMASTSAFGEGADLEMVLATANGEEITLGDVLALKSELPPEYLNADNATLMAQMIDQLVVQELLAKDAPEGEALDLKLEAAERSTRVNFAIQAYVEENLTDEYLRESYDELVTNAPAEEEYNASHILVKTEEEAKAAIERINGGEAFGDVAAELSSDGSAENGGSLGWFGRGQMVPEFEQAVMALEVGGLSAPVQSQFGWHVIILDDKREAGKPSFEDVKDQLGEYAEQQLIQKRVESAKENADISITEGVDPALLDSEF